MKKLVALENLPGLCWALFCLEAVTHADEELLLVVARCSVHKVKGTVGAGFDRTLSVVFVDDGFKAGVDHGALGKVVVVADAKAVAVSIVFIKIMQVSDRCVDTTAECRSCCSELAYKNTGCFGGTATVFVFELQSCFCKAEIISSSEFVVDVLIGLLISTTAPICR